MILWIIDSKFHVRESTWYTTYPIWSFITCSIIEVNFDWKWGSINTTIKDGLQLASALKSSGLAACMGIGVIEHQGTHIGYVTVTKTSSFFIHVIQNEFRKSGKFYENSVGTCTIFIVLIHVRSSSCWCMYDLHCVVTCTIFIVLIHVRCSLCWYIYDLQRLPHKVGYQNHKIRQSKTSDLQFRVSRSPPCIFDMRHAVLSSRRIHSIPTSNDVAWQHMLIIPTNIVWFDIIIASMAPIAQHGVFCSLKLNTHVPWQRRTGLGGVLKSWWMTCSSLVGGMVTQEYLCIWWCVIGCVLFWFRNWMVAQAHWICILSFGSICYVLCIHSGVPWFMQSIQTWFCCALWTDGRKS